MTSTLDFCVVQARSEINNNFFDYFSGSQKARQGNMSKYNDQVLTLHAQNIYASFNISIDT